METSQDNEIVVDVEDVSETAKVQALKETVGLLRARLDSLDQELSSMRIDNVWVRRQNAWLNTEKAELLNKIKRLEKEKANG